MGIGVAIEFFTAHIACSQRGSSSERRERTQPTRKAEGEPSRRRERRRQEQ